MKFYRAYKKQEERKGSLHIFTPFVLEGIEKEFEAEIQLLLYKKAGRKPSAYVLRVDVREKSRIPEWSRALVTPLDSRNAAERIKADFPEFVNTESANNTLAMTRGAEDAPEMDARYMAAMRSGWRRRRGRRRLLCRRACSRWNGECARVPTRYASMRTEQTRTHGLEGLTEEQALGRAFEQAGENLPLLEKLVKAAAEKLGGRAMMRPVNKENGLATKKPSTARDKANRDYRGKIERVVDLIGGTVELPMNGDYAAAVETVQGMLPEGAEVAKVKKLGFTTDAPCYKDVKVSVRFPNRGIGEIIIVDAFVNDAKFNRGGHVIYEIARELETYKNMPEVRNAIERLNELSGIVYDSFADAASLERAKSSASSALEGLKSELKNFSLSSGVVGMLKSPDLMSKAIKPASVSSSATPSSSLIQNISDGILEQDGIDVNCKNQKMISLTSGPGGSGCRCVRAPACGASAIGRGWKS